MKNNIFLLLLATLSASFIFSCRNTNETKETTRGLSIQNIDSSVKPGNDFFLYANGKWYDTATILPTESRAGARLEMDYVAKAHIKTILESAASATNAPGSIEQKVGDLFAAGMDTTTIEKLGYTPIKPMLQQIDALTDSKGMLHLIAEQCTLGNSMLIGQYVAADDKNSSKNILGFYQAGIGLPDRDYYFKTDAATQTVVSAYQHYMATLFMLTGDDSATAVKKVSIVYELEKKA